MIREYQEDDLDTIVHIWLTASIEAHHFIAASYWESKANEMKNIYIPSATTYVYEESGTVLGFVSMVDSYIAALFVATHEQGKGIGRRLINKVKGLHTSLQLGVYSANLPSIAFYQKQGFVVLEEKIEEHTGHLELVMGYNM